jgi:hypothetical protein
LVWTPTRIEAGICVPHGVFALLEILFRVLGSCKLHRFRAYKKCGLPEADEWFALALKESPDADEAPGLLTGEEGKTLAHPEPAT